MSEQIRLNKFLGANFGVSRREADDLIAAGKVLVNGKPAVLGARIFEDDEVLVEGKLKAKIFSKSSYAISR